MRIIKQDLDVYVYVYIDKERCIRWYKNNKLHREDGPSTIWSDGVEFFYLNDIEYFKDEYWKKVHENY